MRRLLREMRYLLREICSHLQISGYVTLLRYRWFLILVFLPLNSSIHKVHFKYWKLFIMKTDICKIYNKNAIRCSSDEQFNSQIRNLTLLIRTSIGGQPFRFLSNHWGASKIILDKSAVIESLFLYQAKSIYMFPIDISNYSSSRNNIL
jgi:hypothetical protein